MSTTITNLGSKLIPLNYARMIDLEDFTVIRKGEPGPSVWRDFGKIIVTDLDEMRKHVDADLTGDLFWGRGIIVDGALHRKFMSSNDAQRFSWRAKIGATSTHKKRFLMRLADFGDVDRTGSLIAANGAELKVPFAATNNNRLITVRIETTDDIVNFLIDSGTMPGMAGNPGHAVADGVAWTFPCFETI